MLPNTCVWFPNSLKSGKDAHRIGGWLGPRCTIDAVAKKHLPALHKIWIRVFQRLLHQHIGATLAQRKKFCWVWRFHCNDYKEYRLLGRDALSLVDVYRIVEISTSSSFLILCACSSDLKIEASGSFETSENVYQTTRLHTSNYSTPMRNCLDGQEENGRFEFKGPVCFVMTCQGYYTDWC